MTDSARERLRNAAERVVEVHEDEVISEGITGWDIPVGGKVEYMVTNPTTNQRELAFEWFLTRSPETGVEAVVVNVLHEDDWRDTHGFIAYIGALHERIGRPGTPFEDWEVIYYGADETHPEYGILMYRAPLSGTTLPDAVRAFTRREHLLHLEAVAESRWASRD